MIPLIGGIQIGGAALGLNTKRIWGALKVLGFSTGISYAYGGDLSFGSQAKVNPTYPQYLEEARSTEGISGRWYAVGYDEEKQDMLYMSIRPEYLSEGFKRKQHPGRCRWKNQLQPSL